ncbi:MAG: hypothetical protein K6A80_01855 [Saccharofermentans sp.]|nr:hypothetical protein [Saccharofermentans sp.]
MRESDRTVIFDCAVALASVIIEQCDALVELCDYIDERVTIAKRISSYESNADDGFHDLGFYFLENKLMSDPDSVALFDIIRNLEAITDAFEDLANSIVRFNITESGETLSDCATALYGAGQMTHDLIISIRDGAPSTLIIRNLTLLDKFKSKYCKFYDEAILELFTEDVDPVSIIKSKAIYDAFKVVFVAFESLSENCYKFVLLQN